jgi:hypothetical protein
MYIPIFLKLCERLRCKSFCIIEPDRSRAVARICFGVESWSLTNEKKIGPRFLSIFQNKRDIYDIFRYNNKHRVVNHLHVSGLSRPSSCRHSTSRNVSMASYHLDVQ